MNEKELLEKIKQLEETIKKLKSEQLTQPEMYIQFLDNMKEHMR